jgi:hypothetical protein
MRSLGNGDYLDDSGRLYITTLGEFDPFAPINQETPQVIKATPFTFEDVPTTGLWSVIFKNNPLKFASHATAEAMAKRITAILSDQYTSRCGRQGAARRTGHPWTAARYPDHARREKRGSERRA